MENFKDRSVWIRIWFVLRGWIRIRSISDRIRNPGCRAKIFSIFIMKVNFQENQFVNQMLSITLITFLRMSVTLATSTDCFIQMSARQNSNYRSSEHLFFDATQVSMLRPFLSCPTFRLALPSPI